MQLSPAFAEWMMGLPRGWITDVPDIKRREALKAAGNGVIHQQGAEALRFLLPRLGLQSAPASVVR
jgi:DNA (cytosine-5)-methyltransferase 1